MQIEVGAPASLPLGFVRDDAEGKERIHLVGLTVQHPPVHLTGYRQAKLDITGARADKAFELALRFMAAHQVPRKGRVEIELAIPSLVGLGSDAILGLSMAKALAWMYDLPYPAEETLPLARATGLHALQGLEIWGFDRGGFLIVDTSAAPGELPSVVHRREIVHSERDAWAFVFFLPRVPEGATERLETDRLSAHYRAAAHLDPASGQLVTETLLPAIDHDSIEAFGEGLIALQRMNQTALKQEGVRNEITNEAQEVLDLMRDFGSIAYGQSICGLCVFGLVHGAKASVELRKNIQKHVGFFGGRVMASIADNTGAQSILKDKHDRVI